MKKLICIVLTGFLLSLPGSSATASAADVQTAGLHQRAGKAGVHGKKGKHQKKKKLRKKEQRRAQRKQARRQMKNA